MTGEEACRILMRGGEMFALTRAEIDSQLGKPQNIVILQEGPQYEWPGKEQPCVVLFYPVDDGNVRILAVQSFVNGEDTLIGKASFFPKK